MDRKAGIDDYEFIRKRCEELKHEQFIKPDCPRNTGGSCMTACSNWSNCYNERQRNNAALTGDDYC